MGKFNQYLEETKEPEEVKVYNKIKDWKLKALDRYARKVGVSDEVVNPIRRDKEMLIDEIMGHLFGDDFESVLMKYITV